ncbi:MAG: SUMF1/EgtB/PvdO family nonheme iron enzyme [Candidatus Sedimenticola sp. 6PFRAG7]
MAAAPKHDSPEILRKLIPLNTLKDAALQKVMEGANFEKLSKGEILFNEGETDNYNVYLLSGSVALLSGGKEVDSVRAGNDTARFPLAHQIPRKFSVKTTSKAEIVRIDNRVLGELLAKAGGATYEVSDFDAEATDDWMSQLLKSRVFQLIPASNIQGVMMRMEEVESKAGDVIIRQGEEGDYFYLINKGRCSVLYTEDDEGEAAEVAQLGAGDSFGEEALLSNKPRGSTIIMLTDGLLLRLSKDDFVQFVKSPLGHTTNYVQGKKLTDKGSVWLDVRAVEAFDERHLPGSINLPFSSLRYQASNLDPDKPYIVYCDDGQLSTTAAYLLVEQGFDITILDKGLQGVPDSVWEPEAEDNVVALRPGDEGAAVDTQEMARKLAEAENRTRLQIEQMKKLKLAFDKAKIKIASVEKEKQDALAQQAGDFKSLKDELSKKEGRLEYVEEQLGKVKELARELDEKEKALSDVEKKLAELQAQQAGKDDESRSQHQQLASVEKSLHDAMAERDQIAGKFSKLEGRQEEVDKALKASEEKVSELEQALKQKSGEEGAHEEALAALKKELEGEVGRRTELEQQIKAVESEGENERSELETKHQQALKESEDRLEQERKAHQELQQKSDTLESDKSGLADELAKAQSEVTGLSGRLSALEQAGGESENQHAEALAALQKSLDEAIATRGDAEQKLQALEAERDQLQGEVKQAQAGADELSVKLVALEESGGESESQHAEAMAALQKSLDDERTSRKSVEQKSEALQGELTAAGEKLAEFESRLSTEEQGAQEQKSQLEQKLQSLESEKSQLQTELDEAAGRMSELEANRIAQEESSVALQRDHEQVLLELRQELEKAVTETEGAASQYEALKSESDGLQEKLQNATSRIEELEQTLATKAGSEEEAAQWQSQIDTFKSQVQTGQDSLKEAEERASGLEAELAGVAEQAAKVSELEALVSEGQESRQQTEERVSELEAELGSAREEAAKVDDLKAQLAEQETQLAQLQEEEKRLEGAGEELSVLRKELHEVIDARDAAQKTAESVGKQLAELQSGGDEVKVLQAELESLTLALEESDHAHETSEKQVTELQAELDELKQAAESATAEVSAETEVALQEERRLRSEADTEVERLNGEVAELRKVMEQYVEQINQAQDGVEGEDAASLRTELQLVREMADTELKEMREELEKARSQLSAKGGEAGGGGEDASLLRFQLEEAQSKLRELEQGGSGDVAETEALRQEGESLRSSIGEREQQISTLQRDLRKLEERIEDRNSEVDRLQQALEVAQVDADEAEFRSNESTEARKQVEDALYQLQQQVESKRPKDSGNATPLRVSKPLDMAAEGRGSRGIVGVAIGAVVAFVVAEGLSFVGGHGELVSGLFADKTGVEAQRPAPVAPAVPTPAVEAPREVAQAPAREPVKKPPPAPVRAPVAAPKPEPAVVRKPARPAMGTKLRDALNGGGRGPEMLYIRGGQFTMGSDRSQLEAEERPAHDVAMSDFAIARHEVSFDDYKRFTQATGHSLPDDLGWGQGSRPVINVSWEDAVAYTEWLSRQTGKKYRLPTEAEWEYAANADSNSLYWWGYELTKNKANCFNCGSRWDGVSTAPAGSFPPNAFGLHSTAGNVMEWVEDCYHFGYEGAPTDGSAWVDAGCRERVVKGGAFNKSGDSLRTTRRTPHEPDTELFVLGFRVARDVK